MARASSERPKALYEEESPTITSPAAAYINTIMFHTTKLTQPTNQWMIFWKMQLAHIQRLLKHRRSFMRLPEMDVRVTHSYHGVA
jgi:hypothetical protein